MNIRPATEQDFAQICSLFTTEKELFWIYPKGSYPFTLEQLQHLMQVRRDLTVAEQDGRILGFANLYNYEAGKSVFIGNVVVDSKSRGQGLGRRLVAHMIDLATQKYALPEVRISVFNENTKALLLYSGFGFVPYEIEERTDFSGARVALIHMRLKL